MTTYTTTTTMTESLKNQMLASIERDINTCPLFDTTALSKLSEEKRALQAMEIGTVMHSQLQTEFAGAVGLTVRVG